MEKLEVFKKYEMYFDMVQDGYIKNHRKFISNEIADAYEKITKKKVNRNWACGSCVIKFYKEVGEWYRNQLQKNKETATTTKKKTNGKTNTKKGKES